MCCTDKPVFGCMSVSAEVVEQHRPKELTAGLLAAGGGAQHVEGYTFFKPDVFKVPDQLCCMLE